MELRDAINACECIKAFACNIDPTVSKNDLVILGEINSSILENLDFLNKWVNDDVIFEPISVADVTTDTTKETTVSKVEPWCEAVPNVEWRKVYDYNLMVSNEGHVWDITNRHMMKQHFRDGDLRISLGKDPSRETRRVSVLVAKAFQIRSADRNDDFIIAFKDGDRRNLKVDNIYWKKATGEYIETRRYLVEDICRRIIQYNGNIEQIMSEYIDAYPPVSQVSVEQIRDKRLYTEISDLFFVNDKGVIHPRTDAMATPDVDVNSGLNVGDFFKMSGDKKLSGELIRDKIKRGDALSLDEKVIIVFMAMDVIGLDKAKDVKKIANVIKNTFGTTIGNDMIQQIMNDYTSDIAGMFRE